MIDYYTVPKPDAPDQGIIDQTRTSVRVAGDALVFVGRNKYALLDLKQQVLIHFSFYDEMFGIFLRY